MISKTTTALIIAMLSLVGLTAPAGVSQTVFAQSVGGGGELDIGVDGGSRN